MASRGHYSGQYGPIAVLGPQTDSKILPSYIYMSFLDKIKSVISSASPQDPNDEVRSALAKHGDNGTQPRLVEHLAYFKTQSDAESYKYFLRDYGFTIGTSDQEFGVAFFKQSSVVGEVFDKEIALLNAKAEILNGEYDGWGCPIVR